MCVLQVSEIYKAADNAGEEFNLINQKPEAAAIDDGFPCGTARPSYIWNIKLYSSTQVPLGLNIHMLSECVRCWK